MSPLVTCILFVALMAASIIWCASFMKRVTEIKIRNCLTFISFGVSLFALIDLLKCSVAPDTTLQTVLTAFYSLPMVVILICAIIVAVSIGKICKGKNPPTLPIIIIALMLIYSVLYAMNVPIINAVPINIVNGVLILLLCESCVGTRLFKTGADYRSMFESSTIPAVVADKNMNILYRTKAIAPDDTSIKSAIENGIEYKPNEDFIVTAQKVDGVFAVFTKEIKELNMLLDELNETSQQLQKSNELIAREKEIRLELTNAEILNSLYDDSVNASIYKLNCVSGIIRSLTPNDKTVRNSMLLKAKMLTSYVKNKFEMLSCIEQSNEISAELFFESIDETAKILEGIIESCEIKITPFNVPQSRIAMLIYDWIENICEFSMLFSGSTFKADIFEHQNNIFMNITLDEIDAHKKFEADKELVRKTASYKGKTAFDIFSSRVSVKIKLPTEVL